VLLISGLHYLGVETGYGDPKYPDDSEDRISIWELSSWASYSAKETRRISAHYSIGKITNFSVFAAAFIPAIFAYSGWNAVIYIAGEFKNRAEICLALCYGQM
jgi:amino acid transporter